jgi:osmotically-inducible protein OsmY
MRYWTEDIADGVYGVKEINNQIKVKAHDDREEKSEKKI